MSDCWNTQGFVKAYLRRMSLEYSGLNYYQEAWLKYGLVGEWANN